MNDKEMVIELWGLKRSCLIRQSHSQWVSWTRPVMPANVIPVSPPLGRLLAIAQQPLQFHPSATLASLIRAALGPRGPTSQLSIFTSSLSLPVFLPRRPRFPPPSPPSESPPSAALDRWHWSASHQRWDSKGDTCQNIQLISVVMATWPMSRENLRNAS